MKKTNRLKGTNAGMASAIAGVLVACSVIAGTFAPGAAAFANSGPAYEYGVTAAGLIVRDENSALAVERETLTFDIYDLPELFFDEEDGEYNASVTAEYTFVNTSDNTVCTSMAFPVGSRPYYTDYYADEETRVYFDTPTITVDSKVIDCEVRHSYGKFTSFDDGVAGILDGWYEDEFYYPDMPVTAYSVNLDKESDNRLASGEFGRVEARGSITCGEGARFICPDYDGFNEVLRFYFDSNPNFRSEDMFYVLGDTSQFSCDWTVVKGDADYADRKTDLKVLMTEEGVTTLKQLILSGRRESCEISERDYYNGYLLIFLANGSSVTQSGFAGGCGFTLSESQFCAWYTYETEVAPHGKFINTVTAPMYPTINFTYNPRVYEYMYYISPAAKWRSFGGLDVVINTPYYMLEAFADFNQADVEDGGKFTASFAELPEGEITFSLCSDPKPQTRFFGFWVDGGKVRHTLLTVFGVILGVGLLAAVVVPTVIVLKQRKK